MENKYNEKNRYSMAVKEAKDEKKDNTIKGDKKINNEIKYVNLDGKKYEALRKDEDGNILIEIDIINSKGLKEKFKQWYDAKVFK